MTYFDMRDDELPMTSRQKENLMAAIEAEERRPTNPDRRNLAERIVNSVVGQMTDEGATNGVPDDLMLRLYAIAEVRIMEVTGREATSG